MSNIERPKKSDPKTKKHTGVQKRRPTSGTKPSLSPVTGIPEPLYPSTKTSALKNEPLYGTNFFSTGVSSLQPVTVRPDYHADMSGLSDIIKSSFNMLKSKNTKLTHRLPYCLYSYYCFSLAWLRFLTITYMNKSQTSHDVAELLHKFRKQPHYVLPKALVHWLDGIGDTPDHNGNHFCLSLQDIPTMDHISSGLRGSFGRAQEDTMPIYASLASPYIYAKYILETLSLNPIAMRGYWDLDDEIQPMPGTGHYGYEVTENCLGWRPISNIPNEAKLSLHDLGFTHEAIPADANNFLNCSFIVLSYVSSLLSELKNVELSNLSSQLMDSGGSTNIFPYIVTDEFCDPWADTSTNQVVKMESRQQLSVEETAIASCQAYRIRRHISEDRLYSNSFPFQRVDEDRNILPQIHPVDLNRYFYAGTGASRLNPCYYSGQPYDRGRLLTNVMARFVVDHSRSS